MLKPGDAFERYTIEAPIGHGGMGSVYRAQDTKLGRRVALKVMADRVAGPNASARLVREARAAAALDHPNAVAIFDAGEVDGAPYIVMELIEGRTLRGEIGDDTVTQAARIAHLADVGRALAAAHRRGLVHRDIKPENVMIRDDGMVKVLDFGIARRTHGDVDPAGPTQTPQISTLTIDGLKLGTPVYMAPEQIRGDDLDGRADQFSWGVLAYELLTGKLPWRGTDALAAMASALTDPVHRTALDEAAVPRPVQDVVLRALSKSAEDRFASMEDAVRALEAAARGEALTPARADDAASSGGSKSRAEPSSGGDRGDAGALPGATAAQKFSTAEIREVLGKAVERQAQKEGNAAKLGFEDLLAIAAEVGVDPESLREASRALRVRSEPKADALVPEKGSTSIAASDGNAAKRAAWLRRQKRDFKRHAAVYVIVNAALLILGLVLLKGFTPWWIWPIPALAWGIGLAIHGFVTATATEDDWEEENERMQWWLEERRRKHEERMARVERLRLGDPGHPADPRARIESSRDADRLRLSTDTGGEGTAQAEEDAAEADPRRAGRRRR